jgi:23S rRNA pseudouridine1911/1915/1917 synthase
LWGNLQSTTEHLVVEVLRIDAYVFKWLPEIPSRAFAAKLIQSGIILCNNLKVKPSHSLKIGDCLQAKSFKHNPTSIAVDSTIEQSFQVKPSFSILYEDEDVIVLDKPAGLVVHPGAGAPVETLVHGILAHCGMTLPSLAGEERAGIVHRIDKDTSGVMVVAKTQLALTKLSADFAAHLHVREYCALVHGSPIPQKIVTSHGRDPRNRLRFAAVNSGKYAETEIVPQQYFEEWNLTLVRCYLQTGRTHQIRVHMAHIGHPIVGDSLYSKYMQRELAIAKQLQQKTLANRQMLHAALLGFNHPRTTKPLQFCAPLPVDFQTLLSLAK